MSALRPRGNHDRRSDRGRSLTRNRARDLGLATVLIALTLPLAGCVGADSGTFPGAMVVARRVDQPFGASCDTVVPGGAPGVAALAKLKVLPALDQVPDLSRFADLIKTAKAQDMFESMQNVTVFVPVNAAFDQLPADQQQKLADPATASALVRSLIVAQDLTRSDLTNQTYPSLEQGATVQVATNAGTITVNGAPVVCGSVTTADARLHLLETVPGGKA